MVTQKRENRLRFSLKKKAAPNSRRLNLAAFDRTGSNNLIAVGAASRLGDDFSFYAVTLSALAYGTSIVGTTAAVSSASSTANPNRSPPEVAATPSAT